MADGLQVSDLGSTNGTFWQGSRIDKITVPPGSTIKVGDTTLRFLAAPAPLVEPSDQCAFGEMVGRSLAMRELFAVLELASPTDATILMVGESGTGKELAARAIHAASRRKDGPFVVVDCSSISDNLAESHLFGHKKGAFTGALNDRKGAFVEASGGTLFLDELGELPPPTQAKLLRVLESRVVHPVGADQPAEVDVRIVAATHRDIVSMVEQGAFRFDLFHRLAVVHVSIPPLRERREDISLLVRALYAAKDVEPTNVSGPNMDLLREYAWPGNVRELRNVLDRAWALSAGFAAGGGDVPEDFSALKIWLAAAGGDDGDIGAHLPFKAAKERWLDGFEKRYLAAVYARFDYNISHASDHAEINRRHFRELLKKHGLHRDK